MTEKHADKSRPRPNIIVFIADQLRADHLGFAGNPIVRTPHLDSLAKLSTIFVNAHVANPTCMPNRATLLTGRWPSAHGTRCNGIALDPDSSTFVRQLSRAGYSTAAVGKLHHQNMGWDFEPDQRCQISATSPLLLDPVAKDAKEHRREAGWDLWEDRSRHDRAYLTMPSDYYGYDEVDLVVGHGDRPGGHWTHWAKAKGINPETLGGPAASPERCGSWEQVYTTGIPAHAHPSSYIGERAAARVRDAASRDNPFFLFVSFPDPHHPFAPPVEYAHRYNGADVSLPIGFYQDHDESPTHVQKMAAARGTPNSDPTMTFCINEEQFRAAAAAQYGLIEFMDLQIGRVLEALEESGQADNTVIVFTSDHGDLFGDHGLMLKHFVHYQAVTRVPLLVHDPRTQLSERRDIKSLVSTADLAPTFLELARAEPFRGIQGRSLLPLLKREVDALREALLIEEDQPFSLEGLPAPVRMRTVITGRGRMTRYFGTDEVEVYDHQADPHELCNIAGMGRAADLQNHLVDAMVEQLAALADAGTAPTSSA